MYQSPSGDASASFPPRILLLHSGARASRRQAVRVPASTVPHRSEAGERAAFPVGCAARSKKRSSKLRESPSSCIREKVRSEVRGERRGGFVRFSAQLVACC